MWFNCLFLLLVNHLCAEHLPPASTGTICSNLINLMGNRSSTSRGDDKKLVHSPTGGVTLSDGNVVLVDFNDDDSMYVPAQPPPDHHGDNTRSITIQDPPPLVLPQTVHVGCSPDEEEVVTPMDNSLTAAVELMCMLIKNGCHLNILPQIMKWTLQVASRPGNKTLFQTMRPMTYHMLLWYMQQHLYHDYFFFHS